MIENYGLTAEELSIIHALREEFGLIFIMLSHAAWRIYPEEKRCESWIDLSRRLLRISMITDESRDNVAHFWMQVWCRDLLNASDPSGALTQSLEFSLAIFKNSIGRATPLGTRHSDQDHYLR
jgi:hypothetical protein